MLAVTSVSYRFNVNGEDAKIMHARRGLRQGDSISPFLFVILMEYMNRLMQKMSRNLDFNFHYKCEKLQMTNLSVADDLLMFARGDKKSLEMTMTTFNKFSTSTGLIVNPSK